MFKFFALIFLFVMSSTFACECYPDFKSKTYQSIKKTWYGKKFSYTCKYSCQGRGRKEVVVGSHQKTVIGDEAGNEIVCDGTIYKEQYSNHTGWFIYLYEGSEWFDAERSDSKEIRVWASRNCI